MKRLLLPMLILMMTLPIFSRSRKGQTKPPKQVFATTGVYLPDSFSTSWAASVGIVIPFSFKWGLTPEITIAELNPSMNERTVEAVLGAKLRSSSSLLWAASARVSYRLLPRFFLELGPSLLIADGQNTMGAHLALRQDFPISPKWGILFLSGSEIYFSRLFRFAYNNPDSTSGFLTDAEAARLSKNSWLVNLYLKIGVRFTL